MREALGQPLQDLSKELLSKVVSKEVARDLRKFKFSIAAGNTKSPNKDRTGMLSADKRNSVSPTRRLNFGSPNNPVSPAPAGNSKEVRELLKELDGSVHNQV